MAGSKTYSTGFINWQAVSSLIGAGILILAGWANVSLNNILKIVSDMDTKIQLNTKDTYYLRKDLNAHIADDEVHKQLFLERFNK